MTGEDSACHASYHQAVSTVALPAVTAPSPLGSEAELIKRASRSDQAAFTELYRRHAQTAWRLAQAVTPAHPEAAASVADGFVRVLRAVRRHRVSVDDPFRPLLLAGVYRSAIDRLRSNDAPPAPLARSADLALPGAAFRSLPERWRAAVWLTEVEGLAPERLAPILAVSPAVAAQLAARGQRALLDRFRQAGQGAPESLGAVLRPLAASLPASLADVATSAWRSSVASDHAGRLVPSVGWVGQHAVAPLRLAVVGVLALGVVSVGVLSQRTTLPGAGPVAGGAPGASGQAGVSFLNNSAYSSGFPGDAGLLLGLGGSPGGFGLSLSSGSGLLLGAGGGVPPVSPPGGGSATGGTGGGHGGGATPPGGGTPGVPAAPGSPSTTAPPTTLSPPTTVPSTTPSTTLPGVTTTVPVTSPVTLPKVTTTLPKCSTTTILGTTLPCSTVTTIVKSVTTLVPTTLPKL
jgi:DNA-directed RNA polymerase specialized sigma24 family protein